jgi:hypothetical protein
MTPRLANGVPKVFASTFSNAANIYEPLLGFGRPDDIAQQMNPWVPSSISDPDYIASDVDTGAGETFSDLIVGEDFVASCKSGAISRLQSFFDAVGYYPPIAYIDNDRFRPNINSVNSNDREDTNLSPQQNLDIVVQWFQDATLGLRQAVDELGIDTKIASWGSISWNRNGGPGISQTQINEIAAGFGHAVNQDFISVALYFTNQFGTDSESAANNYIRAKTTIELAKANPYGLPVIATVRIAIGSSITNVVSAEKWDALLSGAKDGGADGVFVWETQAFTNLTAFAPTLSNLIQEYFPFREGATVTTQPSVNDESRSRAIVLPWSISGQTVYTTDPLVPPNKLSTETRPETDTATGSFIYQNRDDQAVHVQVALWSRGNDNATVEAHIWGWTQHEGVWEPTLLADCQATLGTSTTTVDGVVWRSPDAWSFTDADYTYDTSLKVVGGGTNGRAVLQFDTGSFELIEVQTRTASAGTAGTKIGFRPV